MKTLFYVLTATTLLMAVMVSCRETNVTDVQLNKATLTLNVGGTETLVATVLPKDADDKTVNWTSNNSEVAEVDNTGKITAKAEGTAIITVTTTDGNKTANCTVTVKRFIEEPEMIFVEGGTFMYGLTDEEYNECEDLLSSYDWQHYPQEQKTVRSFYIAKYPITQKLWEDVMGTLPSALIDYGTAIGDNYPVYYVDLITWASLARFISELNRITGKNYRLASSEEWEYAARGGNKSKGYKYSGSNNLDEVAWYSGNSNNSMHPVGQKQPNELGIYDMTGNVWEWTSTENNLKLPTLYEIRGGSWSNEVHHCYISLFLTDLDRSGGDSQTGFRLALSVPEQ